MCGIAGLVCGPHGRIGPAFIPTATRLMRDRGPDDAGYLLYSRSGAQLGREWSGESVGAEVAFVHRRLSVLDLTEAGWQPMSSADGRYHIVFNGEIYNFIELRQELEGLGHTFRSRCDTEVLLAAYAQWDSGALQRFTGMFAFAILDTRQRRIFLARDFFGIKPLYYTFDQGQFAFASEIKILLETGCSRRQVNAEYLHGYLRHGCTDSGGETMLADVHQVPPAHYLVVDLDDVRSPVPVPYWRLDPDHTLEISFEEAARRLREIFLENIDLHLRSDVPVGTALSGGIDSSAIVGAMRHLRGPKLEIHTFTYVAEDSAPSEERWADLAGSACGAVMHKVKCGPEDLAADLDRIVYQQDEPFGGTSIYAQYRVFQSAHQAGIKVMLDGQGADEILAGYPWYLSARLASLIRQGSWGKAARLLGRAAGPPNPGKAWLVAHAAEFLLPGCLHAGARRIIRRQQMPAWMNVAWFKDRGCEPATVTGGTPGRDAILRASLISSVARQSLPQLLRYEDRNSMAFSVESRVPFLTPKLVEFALALPEEYLVGPDGLSKAVMRKAMEGIVPQAILDRRDKIGFATPERHWTSRLEPQVQDMLQGDAAAEMPVLNPAEAEREWARFKAGGADDAHCWRWLNLLTWARRFAIRFD